MYYKIKSKTSSLGKRDVNYNKTLDITFVDRMNRKVIKVYPNQDVYLECGKLPIDAQKLRMRNLITINEISENEFRKMKKKFEPKPEVQNTVEELPTSDDEESPEEQEEEVVERKTTTTTTTTKKPVTKKSTAKKSSTSTKYVKKSEEE
jgi:hypothetical protein